MYRKKLIAGLIFVLLSIPFMLTWNIRKAFARETDTKICEGVFIDRVDIGGMTKAEAETAVDNYMNELRDKRIAIIAGDKVVYTTMKTLEYTYEPNDFIEQALSLAVKGNIIKIYKDRKDIKHGKIVYPLTFTYNENKLKHLVETQVFANGTEPVNASFSRVNGEFVYTNHVIGSKVDVNKTFEAIKASIKNWDRLDMVVKAVMVDDMPAYTVEDLKKCSSVLGEFTTEFKDSSDNRAANVANGAALINNALLYPGDIFSGYDYLLPFTTGNGYYLAHSFNEGRVIDSIGGGICQVATTLYNAVLLSELEIEERWNHSMTVTYVPLSMDATVSEGAKNFRFKNNLDLPVLVEGIVNKKEKTITFRIWGHETRDTVNRRIVFESVKIKEIKPPVQDKITKDPTQPVTYRKVEQKARYGYKAQLYKTVYVNNVETERLLINDSFYEAQPNYVIVGTKAADGNAAADEVVPTVNNKPDSGDVQ